MVALVLLFVLAACEASSVKNAMAPPLLQLCCPQHHYFAMPNATCVPSNQTLHPAFYDRDGLILDQHPGIPNVTYQSECQAYHMTSDEFKLRQDGSILVGLAQGPSYEINPIDHCLIWIQNGTGFSLGSLICFPEQPTVEPDSLYYLMHRTILPVVIGVSACFLLATLIVYCLVPELQDLLGKSFMCSVACLCLSKVFAVVVKSGSGLLSPAFCILIGLGMHTFFLQSFFWLNVISVIVFSSLWWRDKCSSSSQRTFGCSCVYAFGIPIVILTVMVLHDFTYLMGNSVVPRPGFGVGSCWFSNRGAQLVYFYAPIGILVGLNVILFCLSACKLCSIATRSSSSTFQFKNYLKLFLVMGVSWIFEVLSFFFMDPLHPSALNIVWLICDVFNSLLGVLIFFVFACRKKLLKKAAESVCGRSYVRHKFSEDTYAEDTPHQDIHLVDTPKATPPL